MFTMLQEFVQAVVSNSMLLMVVVAAPIAAGAVVFYLLANAPVRISHGKWIGRITRRGRRPGHRILARKGGQVPFAPPATDPLANTGPVGSIASAPVSHVVFIDPFQDEDPEEVYDLGDFDAELEAEDGPDTL